MSSSSREPPPQDMLFFSLVESNHSTLKDILHRPGIPDGQSEATTVSESRFPNKVSHIFHSSQVATTDWSVKRWTTWAIEDDCQAKLYRDEVSKKKQNKTSKNDASLLCHQ